MNINNEKETWVNLSFTSELNIAAMKRTRVHMTEAHLAASGPEHRAYQNCCRISKNFRIRMIHEGFVW